MSNQHHRFVTVVADGNNNVVAVVAHNGKNYYYDIAGLRNLLSRLELEDRIEIYGIIDLVQRTNVYDLYIDIDAAAGLVTTEINHEHDSGR